MKQLYFFDESERERILNLHESATKNQYLINETAYGTGNWIEVDLVGKTLYLNKYLEMERADGTVNDELKLNAGTKFVKGASNSLIAKGIQYQLVDDFTGSVNKTETGDVTYYCNTKRFVAFVTLYKKDIQFYGENFQSAVQKGFDDLCNSLNVQGQPETQKTKEQEVAEWGQKYPCVVNYPGAQQVENTRTDKNVTGSIAYQIGEFTYFINGQQSGKGSISTYTCEDAFFKNQQRVQASPENNKGTTTPQPYKHAKHVTNVQNKLKEIDPAFVGGTTTTGQMDQATINKLMEILMSKKMPETKVETPTPEGPTPETGV